MKIKKNTLFSILFFIVNFVKFSAKKRLVVLVFYNAHSISSSSLINVKKAC